MTAVNLTDVSVGEEGKVTLSSLSDLTGFPLDFLKKELLLDEETMSIEELRASVMNFLQAVMDNKTN